MFFNKVAILGVGLIGASFALAVREKGLCGTISGYGRSEENLGRAERLGIIDEYSMEARQTCNDSDLIVLATPVGTFKEILGEIRSSIKEGAVVTDVGSVKGGLVYALESMMPERVRYVGSHPIAGGDKSGIDDARPDLFNNARCIVTSTEKTDSNAREKIISLWERLGCQVEVMDPFKHDEIYGAVSHLPHIIAYVLVNTVNDFEPGCIEYAGQGFKDTTRIALSSPEMWRDIAVFNKDNLAKLIGLLKEHLAEMERLLDSGDKEGIEREFSRARKLRMTLSDVGRMPSAEGSDSMIADRGL